MKSGPTAISSEPFGQTMRFDAKAASARSKRREHRNRTAYIGPVAAAVSLTQFTAQLPSLFVYVLADGSKPS
jgi:hypothetical protein